MIRSLFAACLFLLWLTPLQAEWVAEKLPMGMSGWRATNGDQQIKTPDEKSAKQAAKAMNQADKKAAKKAKKEDGLKAEPAGPCATPNPTVNC